MSPSPPTNPAPTPPPQLKPTPSPVLQNHHVLSNLLQAAPLPDYTNYLVHLGLAPIDTLSPLNPIVPKTEPFCGDSAAKDIYSIPPIYEQSFGSIYGHIPISASAIAVAPSSYAPEPLAPVENHDTMSGENTQLTSL
ncbi:unnamed protein product [Cylicostephanus goldi]|uniref:Uncharacterized protein n=1 Tax=Cylicostephanus goldi TaxID=71465 RepID=A0A3P6SY38_CYLGO|nr:unnamed protein product [Cylicostephanus goldi]